MQVTVYSRLKQEKDEENLFVSDVFDFLIDDFR